MRIASLIASLGDDHRGLVCPLPLASRTMQHNMLKRVVNLSSPPSMLESQKMDPLLVLSPTQDEVYEGVGDPTIFSPMSTTRTCLPTCRCTTMMGLLPINPPALPSQTAIANTSTDVLPLASQDVQIKSSSVVTDVTVDTQALVGNVSLVNEINFVFNPVWVKSVATILLVAGARFISSEFCKGDCRVGSGSELEI